MLRAGQPTLTVIEHLENGISSRIVSRNAEVHSLAAEAILAIAPPQDPARERANEVLGR